MGGGLQRDEGFIARMGPSQSISTWPELPAGRVPPTPSRTPHTPPAHAVRCPPRPTPVPSPCTTMAGRCRQCSQPTEWAPDVGSDVCTSCGTLADPSQSVLTSHIDFPNDASTRDYPSLPYTRPTALKSLRGTAGWLLAGQGKEATHDRNKVRSPPAFPEFLILYLAQIALHESIRTLAVRLAHPGIAPRAQALFDLALHRASLRWGRPAKLAAGAAVLFALREAGCPDATPDLAVSSPPVPFPISSHPIPARTPISRDPTLPRLRFALVRTPAPLLRASRRRPARPAPPLS